MRTFSRRRFNLLLGSTGLAACTGGLDGPDASRDRDAHVAEDAASLHDGGPGADAAGADASVRDEGLFASRTKTVSVDADGMGDGSDARPWTLAQAMELAVSGDIVGVRPGRYVGRQPQFSIDDPAWVDNIPAWAPANDGTADAPIVFVAQNLAAFHDTERSELYSGATYAGSGPRHGWPCFGTRARSRTRHVQWIGFYSNEADSEGHVSQDCGVVTCWNADHVTIAACHIVGDVEAEGGDNYSAIRLEGLEDSHVHDNLLEGFWGGAGINNTGITLYGVDRLIVEHNHFRRCAQGIQPKGENYGLEIVELTVRLNYFEDCAWALRLHRPVANPGGSRSRIYQNLVQDTRYFIELTTSSGEFRVADVDIFNNTIVHGRDGGDPGCIWWAAAPTGGDSRVFNNVFFDVDSYLGSYVASAAQISSFATYDHNALFLARSTFGGSGALQDLTLSEWQSAFGGDQRSITDDPGLDAAFRPLPDSPCLGAGRDLLGVFGPVDGAVNIGAFVSGTEMIGVSSERRAFSGSLARDGRRR